MTHATVNGVPAALDDLVPLAFAGYGHYTSMQMRGGRVRGLRFHLERLRAASLELFGVAVPDAVIRGYVRATTTGDASLMVHVFGPESVLVRAGDPEEPSLSPVRVRTARFGRYLPHLKNPATMGAIHLRRQAQADGYDDVLFVGEDGLVAEGSTWNVVFLDADGATTVFPVAPMLVGTSMQLIRAGLAGGWVDRPVPVLPGVRGAALTNSINPARPIAAIDDIDLPVDESWLARLRAAHAGTDPEPV